MTGQISPRSSYTGLEFGEDTAAMLADHAAIEGLEVSKLIGRAVGHILTGCDQPTEVVIVSTQQSNDIVRLIRAGFNNVTIAEWTHTTASAVEAIGKELS